jgi:hypothetical protein
MSMRSMVTVTLPGVAGVGDPASEPGRSEVATDAESE